jgi:hypothetical protein
MTIEDAGVVDAATIRAGSVVLVISDHLDWVDERQHLLMLQGKINDYISFVESGEVWSAISGSSEGSTVLIEVVTRFDPPPIFFSFLKAAETFIPSDLKTSLSWRAGPEVRPVM